MVNGIPGDLRQVITIMVVLGVLAVIMIYSSRKKR